MERPSLSWLRVQATLTRQLEKAAEAEGRAFTHGDHADYVAARRETNAARDALDFHEGR